MNLIQKRGRKSKQAGAALIELALVFPLLLLLTLVTTEFGRALYQYNTITKAVRSSAHYLSTKLPGTHVDEARNLVVYGSTVDTGRPLALGLALTQVPAPTWQLEGAGPQINTVTVTVTGYVFAPLYPSVFGVAFGNANGEIPFGDISATMRAPS